MGIERTIQLVDTTAESEGVGGESSQVTLHAPGRRGLSLVQGGASKVRWLRGKDVGIAPDTGREVGRRSRG